MNANTAPRIGYRAMSTLAVIVGIVGITLQFLPDWQFFSIFLSVVVLGSLIGSSKEFDAGDRQQLGRSYKFTLEWLMMSVFAAYAVIELSHWVAFFGGAAAFLNEHWSGLVLSLMCLLIGIAGLQRAPE
ncbi:MAG: hypothetical protein U0528_07755 [Anaerolineae bacterium]|nr:hypothetical protein [Anaerolineae bacterium]